MSERGGPDALWADALLAAAVLAVDPPGTGVALRALAGPPRDAWLAYLRDLLPPATPLRRLPLNVTDGRLLGGLDLPATLNAGRPIVERGLLAEADGGLVLVAMAERLAAATAARLVAVLDRGEIALERDGLALRLPASLGVVALDEGMADDERPPDPLLDRLALYLDLSGIAAPGTDLPAYDAEDVAVARSLLPSVQVDGDAIEALCGTASALGIRSLRASLAALRVARAAAALAGRDAVAVDDALLAARLVLAPRATVMPPDQPAEAEAAPEPEQPEPAEPPSSEGEQALEDQVLAAARAAIPADLLASLKLQGGAPRSPSSGRAGALQHAATRGRPAGARPGEPRAGARLNLIETLRAAAPWQRVRRRDGASSGRIEVRREDFRVTRHKQRSPTTTIFCVDASGSAAFHRLAEAKGAVELLLADCYVRRDRVAMLAFRGRGAELLLPPTRSLTRAKRSLAGLPGGGGTPLAAGLDAGVTLAEAIRRRGDTPVLIVLTDGRANVARDGIASRARAGEEALTAARRGRAAALTSVLVDTSPQPQATAQRLAAELGARYLPLPYADAASLSRAVQVRSPR